MARPSSSAVIVIRGGHPSWFMVAISFIFFEEMKMMMFGGPM